MTASPATSATKSPVRNSTLECTKFDKLLLVFKDGHYQVVELPEKLFVGPDLVYCGLPERDRVFTLAYTNREATYLKRFTFGGTILNKIYHCIPPKSKILFFEPDTPAEIFIRYKPGAVPENQSADLQPERDRSQGAKDARAADLHQRRFLHQQQAATRLGRGSNHHKTAVRLDLENGCELRLKRRAPAGGPAPAAVRGVAADRFRSGEGLFF